jgi:L-threonylcarbamoyladenylate synthase
MSNFISEKRFTPRVASLLQNDGVGVIPTDTIYGIVGSALSKKAVARIYRLRKRNLKKPMIVLIGSMIDLKQFGIFMSSPRRRGSRGNKKNLDSRFHLRMKLRTDTVRGNDKKDYVSLANVWPGKISVLLPCASAKSSYLHRGTKHIAFRMPKSLALRALLKKTGPLVAPSANIEGVVPAKTAKEAFSYFGKNVDFYVDGGRLVSKPSTLVKIENGKIVVIRKGAGVVHGVRGREKA